MQPSEAVIKPCADIIKHFPKLAERLAISPPGLRPRLRCVVFVKDKDDPTRMERVRVHSQCVPDLRGLRDSIDKDYSRRAATKLAIPILLSEINLLGDPQEAERRLRSMVKEQGLTRKVIEMAENASDASVLLRGVGQILRGGIGRKSGSRS